MAADETRRDTPPEARPGTRPGTRPEVDLPDDDAPAGESVHAKSREVGRRAVAILKQRLAVHVAEALKRDPERAERAVSLGIVSRDWLDAPTEGPISELPPLQAIERVLSRYIAEHPTFLTRLDLTPLEVLGEGEEPEQGEPVVTTRLAVLFTDLEGFTEHTSRVGDAAASRMLTAHYAAVDEAVAARGGKVAKRLGDGLMVTFPTEQAAVLTGLQLINLAPRPLRMRAGTHAGEVVWTGEDVFGHVVNVASRVAAEATGGTLLVTDDVRAGAGLLPGVRFEDRHTVSLRGIEDPLDLWRARRRFARRR